MRAPTIDRIDAGNPHSAQAGSRVYDPNNLHPLDAEARKHDPHIPGIDWDEIIATTEADRHAGRAELYHTFEEFSAEFMRRTDAMLARYGYLMDTSQGSTDPA